MILSLMAEYSQNLNALFQALGDPTRRGVIARLSRGPASVSDLAAPFEMALPSFMKHIRQLEQSGWISTRKTGRVRTCAIDADRFAEAQGWLESQRLVWEQRTDRLERFVTENKEKQ